MEYNVCSPVDRSRQYVKFTRLPGFSDTVGNDIAVPDTIPSRPDQKPAVLLSRSDSSSLNPRVHCQFSVINCGRFRDISKVVTTACWSPIIWVQGYRRTDDFQMCMLMVLDFDGPGYSIEACIEDFWGVRHIIGTTKSHGQIKNGVICDRYRLIVPFSRPILSLAEYLSNIKRAVKSLPADQSCTDGGRFFFPCIDIVSVNDVGIDYQVVECPVDASALVKSEVQCRRSGNQSGSWGILPPWDCALLRQPILAGQRNCTCFHLGLTLTRHGFDEAAVMRIVRSTDIKIDGDFTEAELIRATQSGIAWAHRNRRS